MISTLKPVADIFQSVRGLCLKDRRFLLKKDPKKEKKIGKVIAWAGGGVEMVVVRWRCQEYVDRCNFTLDNDAPTGGRFVLTPRREINPGNVVLKDD